MESHGSPTSTSLVKCFDSGCGCLMMNRSLSGTCLRSEKSGFDKFEEENGVSIPMFILQENARVEIGNECMALREMVNKQQQTIEDLITELEEERNASSSAANEAMSMILRLQREKAEVQMEARQFKRYIEEKMAHDKNEILELEDLLYKREQSIQSLVCEVQAYKHRMMSYGLTEADIDVENGMSQQIGMIEDLDAQFEFPHEIYPQLKCKIKESHNYADGDDEVGDIEKYACGETPQCRNSLKVLEHRINQLERSPRTIHSDGESVCGKNMLEKIIVGQSPARPRHIKIFSTDSSNSLFTMGADFYSESPKLGSSSKKTEYSYLEETFKFGNADDVSEVGDDICDRIYTIDSIHQGASINGVMDSKASFGFGCDKYMTTPRGSLNNYNVKDIEIQKLHARLHDLEADRESMRQAIISIGTGNAQMVLLKEIAQNLCKETSPTPRKMPVIKQLVVGSLSFVFKWMVSFVFWRKKPKKCKYMFELSPKNIGVLILLDRAAQVGNWKHISSKNM